MIGLDVNHYLEMVGNIYGVEYLSRVATLSFERVLEGSENTVRWVGIELT